MSSAPHDEIDLSRSHFNHCLGSYRLTRRASPISMLRYTSEQATFENDIAQELGALSRIRPSLLVPCRDLQQASDAAGISPTRQRERMRGNVVNPSLLAIHTRHDGLVHEMGRWLIVSVNCLFSGGLGFEVSVRLRGAAG